MIIVYLYYAVFLVAAIAAVVLSYRALRHRSRFLAASFSIVPVVVLVLLYPIPIHGGVTFLIEILLEECQTQQQRHEVQVQEEQNACIEILNSRFAGPLEFHILEPSVGTWSKITTGKIEGWYESQSRLVWTDPLSWPDAPSPPSLSHAKAFCQALSPEGNWALPTEAELYFFWKADGLRVSPGQGFSSLAHIVDSGLKMEFLTIFRGHQAGYALRCVARGLGVPETGFTQDDTALSEWNTFQLNKADIF